MSNNIYDGMKFGFGFVLFMGIFSSLIYAGYHSANQISAGTFVGDYLFTGDVNFSNANVIGLSTSGVPSGLIGSFAMSSCPSGWLEANGTTISRTTYATLFSSIGTIYGAGDGSTTFKIPDYRGYFLRGWSHGTSNDPDRSSRTDRGDGTTGDFVGTKQDYEIQSHNHIHAQWWTGNPGGIVSGSPDGINHPNVVGGGGTMSTTLTGGSETRPKNINVLYCIKT